VGIWVVCARANTHTFLLKCETIRTYPEIIFVVCAAATPPHTPHIKFNFRIDTTHRPGLRPEDEAPTGQLTNEIIFGRLESS